jgi:hypothetical protein
MCHLGGLIGDKKGLWHQNLIKPQKHSILCSSKGNRQLKKIVITNMCTNFLKYINFTNPSSPNNSISMNTSPTKKKRLFMAKCFSKMAKDLVFFGVFCSQHLIF